MKNKMLKMKRRERKIVFAFLKLVTRATPEELAELSVKRAAERMGISAARLSRAFKSYYFCTPMKILILNKQSAFEKLIKSNRAHNLKEALEILDINSQSNFIQKYKDFRHKTPGEMIRSLKKEAAGKAGNNMSGTQV